MNLWVCVCTSVLLRLIYVYCCSTPVSRSWPVTTTQYKVCIKRTYSEVSKAPSEEEWSPICDTMRLLTPRLNFWPSLNCANISNIISPLGTLYTLPVPLHINWHYMSVRLIVIAESYAVPADIPQGELLSPLLFVISITVMAWISLWDVLMTSQSQFQFHSRVSEGSLL